MTTDRRRLFDVSWRAIAKVIVAAALVWAWFQLWQFVMVIVLAITIAVALDPVVQMLERRAVPRWLGATLTVFVIAATAAAMFAFSWVSIAQQSRFLVENITATYRDIRSAFPAIQRVIP